MATMERKAVTEAERAALPTACSRCGDVIPEEGWHNGWPLYGRLEIGFPAQAFAALRGRRHIADKSDFEWWATGHPAMTENGAQSVTFEWGNGYRFDSRGRFRMCYECQRSLLAVLGTFFGIAPTLPHDAPEPREVSRMGTETTRTLAERLTEVEDELTDAANGAEYPQGCATRALMSLVEVRAALDAAEQEQARLRERVEAATQVLASAGYHDEAGYCWSVIQDALALLSTPAPAGTQEGTDGR